MKPATCCGESLKHCVELTKMPLLLQVAKKIADEPPYQEDGSRTEETPPA